MKGTRYYHLCEGHPSGSRGKYITAVVLSEILGQCQKVTYNIRNARMRGLPQTFKSGPVLKKCQPKQSDEGDSYNETKVPTRPVK